MSKPVKKIIFAVILYFPVLLCFNASAKAGVSGTEFVEFSTRGQSIVVAKNWHPWWVTCPTSQLCVRPEWKKWAQGNRGQEIFSYGAPHTGGVFQYINAPVNVSVSLSVRGIYRLYAGGDACSSCANYFRMFVSAGPVPSNTGAGFSANQNINAPCLVSFSDLSFSNTPPVKLSYSGSNFVVSLWMQSDFNSIEANSYCRNISDHNQVWKID